jgi:hypothetical protein
MKKKIEKIEELRKKYQREWLLIAIEKIDPKTTTPLTGRLLAHSPHREEIDQKSMRYKKPALVVFSEDKFPEGYVAAFHLHS